MSATLLALAEGENVDRTDLRALVPHVEAGARALRERHRWLARHSFEQTEASTAAIDAAVLAAFAGWLRCVEASPEERARGRRGAATTKIA